MIIHNFTVYKLWKNKLFKLFKDDLSVHDFVLNSLAPLKKIFWLRHYTINENLKKKKNGLQFNNDPLNLILENYWDLLLNLVHL